MPPEPPTVQAAIDQASLVLHYLESNRDASWDLTFLETHCQAILEFARQAQLERAGGDPGLSEAGPVRPRLAG